MYLHTPAFFVALCRRSILASLPHPLVYRRRIQHGPLTLYLI